MEELRTEATPPGRNVRDAVLHSRILIETAERLVAQSQAILKKANAIHRRHAEILRRWQAEPLP